MKLNHFIIIFALLWGGVDACAQLPEELSSRPEQWQLTLDTIKSKAHKLLLENNGLQAQYHELASQEQHLLQLIYDQQDNIDQLNRFIKERHGRTSQQMRIEELTEIIKIKKQKVKILEEQFENLQIKQSILERQIQTLNDTISNLEAHRPSSPQVDDQLTMLRKQLEDQLRQEVILKNETIALKNGGNGQNLNLNVVNAQNRQLQARLDALRLQELKIKNSSSDAQLAMANARMINKLKQRRDQLNASINAYETRMDQLRESSLVTVSWPVRKKRLIHEMVQKDARNNLMREKIKDLHEDINILKDQVAKLERRIDFIKGKALPL